MSATHSKFRRLIDRETLYNIALFIVAMIWAFAS
jgi:hypothetical protein